MPHVDNLIKVGETITEILKDIQTTDQILDIEQLILLSVELIFRATNVFRFTDRESMISVDSVVPTFKQTSDPIEEVFQMQIDNTIETDYSYIHSEPLDVYSRQILYDEDVQDTVYGTDEEFNTLFYDIEQSSDTEASEQQVSDQASISKSVISTFVCTQQNTQSVCLAQVNGKVKRMWVKALFKSDPKINPNFALDMPTYTKTTAIHSFHPTVIHATYLYSDSDLDTQFQLYFDGTVTTSTLTGLLLFIHFWIEDVRKHYSARKYMTRILNIFKITMKYHFWRKILYTVGNGQQIYAHKMIALPLKIQDHYFEFLVLIVDILDENDFIIGLEAATQLEAVYHMTSHIVNIQSRSVPLFFNKDIN